MNDGIRAFFRLTGMSRSTLLLMSLNALAVGAINAGMLSVLAQAVSDTSGDSSGPMLLWAFAGGFVLYMALQRIGARNMAEVTEQCCAVIRERLLRAVFQAEVMVGEVTGPHMKRTLLTRDAMQVSMTISTLASLIGSLTTAVGAIVYLVWLSPSTALLVGGVIVLAVLVYQGRLRGTTRRMREAYDATDVCFSFADDLFLGSKELKLDCAFAERFMNDDLLGSLWRSTRLTAAVKAELQDLALIGVVAFYGLTGLAAFGLGSWLGLDRPTVISVVLVLLFLQAHVHAIVQRLPSLGESMHAQRRILDHLGTLESHPEVHAADRREWPDDWRVLRLENVGFAYDSSDAEESFHLRDINLEVPRGSTVFIVGGNGSGKTTLAKLLLGLYRPDRGHIRVDNTVVDDSNRLVYRNGFNAVFCDTHLFRRSIKSMAEHMFQEVLRILGDFSIQLRLSADERVDVRPFSQGQKRRLASAFVLASDKPLCLFDEWTADQDPEFRHYFYHSFLPRLRAEGRTLFVITHDDRYFHHADLVIRLDAGRIAEVVNGGTAGSVNYRSASCPV